MSKPRRSGPARKRGSLPQPPSTWQQLVISSIGDLHRRFGPVPVGTLGIVVFFLAAWYGALGAVPEQVLVRYLGSPPLVVSAPPSVRLDYAIVDADDAERHGVFQADCRAGERVLVTVTLSRPAYLLLFGWDGRKAYGFSNQKLDVHFVEGQIEDVVTLDENPGIETFYAIVSDRPYLFLRDIQPRLAAEPALASKGGEPSLFPLELPVNFGKAFQQCHHLS